MSRPDPKPPPPPPDAEIPQGLEADLAPLSPGDRPLDQDADPYHNDSLQAQKAFDSAVEAANADREDDAVRRFLTAAKLAEIAREWYLAALAFRRVGDFLVNPKPPSDLERAFRMYRRAVDAYYRCGLVDEARELAYYLLRLQLARGRELHLPWPRRVELWAYWLVAGFGYRPMRVVGLAALTVVLFGLLFWANGGVVAAGSKEPAGFWDCLYFSGVTFATIGYGDFIPAPAVRPLALVEGFVGALTMGFFVAVLANRLRR
jgi:tetratricopeptide (TPR) repeat protein